VFPSSESELISVKKKLGTLLDWPAGRLLQDKQSQQLLQE
jgi:hypothetical protein